jgi:hypothetical protein
VARHPRKSGEPIESRGPEYFEPFVKALRRKLLAPPDSVLVRELAAATDAQPELNALADAVKGLRVLEKETILDSNEEH